MGNSLRYTIVAEEDGTNVSFFAPGRGVLQAHSTHPNFAAIVSGLTAGDEAVADLFDIAETAATKFEQHSERVYSRNGRLYLDGVELDDALAKQIVGFITDGEDFLPLVNFYERIAINPNPESVEHLYKFVSVNEDSEQGRLTITEDGYFIAYKGVNKQEDGSLVSGFAGHAIVNGEEVNGNVPNEVGSVVEMPRDEVTFDPTNHCHVGLHVGTYSYAKSYANGAMLKVLVDPRDVVSVPNDSAEKMRVCRYRVLEVIDAPETNRVVAGYTGSWGDDDATDEGFEEDYCVDCGEYLDDCDCEGERYTSGADDYRVDEDPPEDDLCDDCEYALDACACNEDEADPENVNVNDVFSDTDSRRAGREFWVKRIENGFAYGTSYGNDGRQRERSVAVDRLLSRKYKRVARIVNGTRVTL